MSETTIEKARRGRTSDTLEAALENEHLSTAEALELIASGRAVIPVNRTRNIPRPCMIGGGSRIKVNANIGSSMDHESMEEEIEKLKTAVAHGADTVMDLSTGKAWKNILHRITGQSPVPVGTVPVYQVFGIAMEEGREVAQVSPEEIFSAVEDHCRAGVDYLTLHCGVTRRSVDLLRKQGRRMGMVSRGGSLMAEWMEKRGEENPLYARFDQLTEILREYDVTYSLGDGLRPGCIDDAGDRGQIEELISLGELQKRALAAGVQTMIEGPGHVPMDRIAENMRIQKSLCGDAPFYVLGPIVTDIAPGYDHITSAIGGAIAAWHGADFLCYVTPAEHLRLPNVDDVRTGVVTARIAAHAADLARGIPGAAEKDRAMADARASFDWEAQYRCAIDPVTARKYRDEALPEDGDVCSMCGHLCAIKTSRRAMETD
ncbi:MAG TPA: phosphomethylpyrimidine synthase ThiC [Candidatus Sabulitectum sp.]|nr:phosphomethylpyrimidine synthase ThiC [Candidatus Sabulitectum sp.]HPF33152.1 phosphomethylpyrimidine synthase ThiC [Candidatus Sabulitectum sp.]HPJ27531.1 phosphomethylpyrimidine synthase ThiC [Candidatus Sabulitectum sp.]HPR21533.1 phosphomethylpyrimidine synthase ThiC [Candidatus Sabulitectum sp.]